MLMTGDLKTMVTQIVFIDGSVDDAAILEDAIAPCVQTVHLDPDDDGIRQIARHLVRHHVEGLSGISIVAHGAEGQVQLGTATLSVATIEHYRSDLNLIGTALRPCGAIQLYSCNTARNAAGLAFLGHLSAATGAAGVEAASHVVGAPNEGGCWDLNVSVGAVGGARPFNAAALENYQGVLPVGGKGKLVFATSTVVEEAPVTNGTIASTTTLSTDYTTPVGLAVDAPLNEYLVADSDFSTFDRIESGSLAGGPVTTIFNVPAPDQTTVSDLAINTATGTLYYSAAFDGNSAAQGGVYSINIGNGTTLVAGSPTPVLSQDYVNSLALDTSNNLLFAAEGQANVSNSLWVVNLNNDTTTNLTAQLSSAIQSALGTVNDTTLIGAVVDPLTKTVYFSTVDLPAIANDAANPAGVGTNIFSASYVISGNTVSLGASSVLYSGTAAGVPVYLKLNTQDNVLYESSGLDNRVYSLSLSGSGALTPVVTSQGSPSVLAYVSTPVVNTSGTVAVSTANTPLILDAGVTVTNSDSTDLAGATVSVAGGTFATDGDTLATVTTGTNIDASYDSANETLTLTGTDTAADYQSVLDSVTFSTTATSIATRTIDWTATNGALTSDTTTSSVTINSSLCFCVGTLIGTPAGEVQVEKLKVGDLVLTAHNGARRIMWIGQGKVLATRGTRSAATPVIVLKSALGDNLPHQDLRITKAHSLYWDGVLIPVEFLVNHKTIIWDDRAQEVEIYHVELESHDLLIANGVPAESYRDDGNRWLFRNSNESWHLPPQEPCAPVLTGGPIVDAAWRHLLGRAGSRNLPPLTDDPDLHLIVDGRRVEIAEQHGQVRIFRLAQRPASVFVASRQGVPAELGLVRDSRSLGVPLRRIAIRNGTRFAVLNADDARLIDGFHDYEMADNLRWTSGYATIPTEIFAGFTGGSELVLTLCGAMQYPDDGRQAAA